MRYNRLLKDWAKEDATNYINTISWNPQHMSIFPNYIVTYYKRQTQPKGFIDFENTANILSKETKASRENLKLQRLTNNLSTASRRKMGKAVNWMASMSTIKRVTMPNSPKFLTFRLNFITLTLPSKQQHSDATIKKECLDIFLQWLRDKHKVTKYVWRAELQGNGNVHYHIVTDTFVHHQSVRHVWNRTTNRLGYLDRFYEKFGHMKAPSTEIKAVKATKDIAIYISKYISKSDKSKDKDKQVKEVSRIISGHLYGISRQLSSIKPAVINSSNSIYMSILKAIKRYKLEVIDLEFAKVYVINELIFRKLNMWLDRRYPEQELYPDAFSIKDYFNILSLNPRFELVQAKL